MSKNKPKITVVTVAFNAKNALQTTMSSINNQDYPFLEYIVIDGGSSDDTLEMLKTYNGKLDKWISEPDKGIYDAMNKAVHLATGDYCIFMNAGDCFVSPTTVSEAASMFEDADVVYGDITKEGNIKKSLSPRNCHKMFYCHQTVFVRTECLREFPFDIRHKFSADFKQAKQLYLAGKRFQQLNIVIADFDTSGISNTQRSKGLWDNIKVIYETDNIIGKIQLLPRLFITYIMCRLRNK